MPDFPAKIKELTSNKEFNQKINRRLGEINAAGLDDAQLNQALITIVLEEAQGTGVEITKDELLSYVPDASDEELASVSGGLSTQSACNLGAGVATVGCGIAAAFTLTITLAASAIPAAGLGGASQAA